MIAIKLDFEKETKNTIQFKEQGDEPVVRTVYVAKKQYAELGSPQSIEVTIKGV